MTRLDVNRNRRHKSKPVKAVASRPRILNDRGQAPIRVRVRAPARVRFNTLLYTPYQDGPTCTTRPMRTHARAHARFVVKYADIPDVP